MAILESTVELGHYRLLRELGRESFSRVWLAEHTDLHKPVAVKIIEKSVIPAGAAETRFIREVNLLSQMDHPFVVRTFEVFDDDIRHYLVMEFVDHGSLLAHVRANGPLPEGQARRYFVQLIGALDYLHSSNYVPHRNLSPENILLDRFNNIRLVDFGLAGNVLGPISSREAGPCSAPEVASGKRYVYSSDIWSAGVVLYFMLTGEFLFGGADRLELFHSIMESNPVFEGSLSPPLIDLLRKLLQRSREERITIPKILEHPWFSLGLFKSIGTIVPSETIDMEVIEVLAKAGYDPKILPEIIARDRNSDQGILYKIIRRDNLTVAVDALISGTGEGTAQMQRFAADGSSGLDGATVRRTMRPPRIPGGRSLPPAMPRARMYPVHVVSSLAMSIGRSGVRGSDSPRPGTTRPRPVRAFASSGYLPTAP
jgi:serine/threonine protein kinase